MATRLIINDIPGNHLAPPVPMPIPQLLVRLAVARGIDEKALLHAAGLDPKVLTHVEALMPAADYAALIFQTLAMTGDPCFGIELGLNIPPTMFGFLGLALICASNLREALEIGARYALLGSRFVEISPEEQADGMVLTVRERMPLGFAQQFAIESTMSAWLNCAQLLGGSASASAHLTHARLSFAWPKPADFKRYEKHLPPTSFDAPAHQLFVPHHLLACDLQLAQPFAARQAQAQCEQELTKVMLSDESFVALVAESLALSDEGYPNLQQVATRLNMSTRTLARRLERLGVNFRQVVDERRKLEAQSMLRTSRQGIDEIAIHLGYLNPANFTRAFKRWTGETPSAYRLRVNAA